MHIDRGVNPKLCFQSSFTLKYIIYLCWDYFLLMFLLKQIYEKITIVE